MTSVTRAIAATCGAVLMGAALGAQAPAPERGAAQPPVAPAGPVAQAPPAAVRGGGRGGPVRWSLRRLSPTAV